AVEGVEHGQELVNAAQGVEIHHLARSETLLETVELLHRRQVDQGHAEEDDERGGGEQHSLEIARRAAGHPGHSGHRGYAEAAAPRRSTGAALAVGGRAAGHRHAEQLLLDAGRSRLRSRDRRCETLTPPAPLSQPPPRLTGERGAGSPNKKLSSSFSKLTTPSSPGGRGGGWEKRVGVMRASAAPQPLQVAIPSESGTTFRVPVTAFPFPAPTAGRRSPRSGPRRRRGSPSLRRRERSRGRARRPGRNGPWR